MPEASTRRRAARAVVHGIGEHGGRYEPLAVWFTDRGFSVHTFDLRGHGHSEGTRGHIDSWDQYRDDLAAFIARVRTAEEGLPVFGIAHSMGGLIALEFCLHQFARAGETNLDGLVVSAPAVGKIGVAAWRMAIARALSLILPRFSLRTRIGAEFLSRDPEAVRQMRTDPLAHGRGSARLGTEIVGAIRRVHAEAGRIRLPLLVIHGTRDEIADPEASRAFFDRVEHEDKDYRAYDGGYHELFNDTIREQVLEDVAAWIEQRL